MRSMTGFGAGGADLGQVRVRIEIRSLNHRHQDLRLRLPAELHSLQFFLEQEARTRLGRGRFDISVHLEGAPVAAPTLDEGELRSLYRRLATLRDELAPGTELPLHAVLPFFSGTPKRSFAEGALEEPLSQALTRAIFALDKMREEEGQALGRELLKRVEAMESIRHSIATASAELVAAYALRLRERIARLLADASVELSQDRLAAEVALIADRSDITEELVRIDSHLGQLRSLLSAEGPVGRRLDFLLQELGREANTIGSKSQHAPLAHLVVDLKAELERFREQIQNVD